MFTANHRKFEKLTRQYGLKRNCVTLIAVVMLCNLLTGCQDKEETKENSGYKTMTPPEDGWTIEELASVTYLCHAELPYPTTIATLGDGFSCSFDDCIYKSENGEITASLNYNNRYLGIVQFEDCYEKEDVSEQSSINLIMIANPEVDEHIPIIINGIELGDTKKEVLHALGEQYKVRTTLYSYFDRETGEEFFQVHFNNEELSYVVLTF